MEGKMKFIPPQKKKYISRKKKREVHKYGYLLQPFFEIFIRNLCAFMVLSRFFFHTKAVNDKKNNDLCCLYTYN